MPAKGKKETSLLLKPAVEKRFAAARLAGQRRGSSPCDHRRKNL
jgi:hypothetical protein